MEAKVTKPRKPRAKKSPLDKCQTILVKMTLPELQDLLKFMKEEQLV